MGTRGLGLLSPVGMGLASLLGLGLGLGLASSLGLGLAPPGLWLLWRPGPPLLGMALHLVTTCRITPPATIKAAATSISARNRWAS